MRTFLIGSGLALVGLSTSAAQVPDHLKGDWTGALTPQLPLILHIGQDVTLTSVAQSNTPMPATLRQTEGHIIIELPAFGVKYDATLSADGRQLSGGFQQGASTRPVILTLGAPVPAAAPAAPVATSPPLRQDREVSISGGQAPLYGSLTTPDQPRAGPAVLIIAGSGPTDRDSNSSIPGLRSDTYKMLAAALAERGISSLRYDKRGIAKSGPAMVREEDLRLSTYVDDAIAWARFLKNQPGITCVAILGHSEGALIAAMAAQKTPVCGLISVSGAGRTMGAVMREQYAATDLPLPTVLQINSVINELEHGRLVPDIPVTDAAFHPTVQPYLISELSVDPTVEIKKTATPLLIIQGDNDVQITVPDARLLSAARPDAKLVILPGVNHVLKTAPRDRNGNVATYANPALPLAPGLVDPIVEFVSGLAPR